MIRRGISLAMAAAILIVYLQSQLASNDALFLFISSNLAVNICLIGLACTAVWLSFQTKFKSARAYIATSAASAGLGLFGIAGLLSAGLDRYLFSVIGPLDYVLLFEAAVVFGICALSYEHPKASFRLPAVNLVHLRQLAGRLTVPALPASPRRSRPSHA
jgi:hypothetical protein